MGRYLLAGVLVLLAALSAGAPALAQDGDYLSPELRQHVEQLKRDAAETPTNADNAYARGLVLWPWVNALIDRGESLSGDIPFFIASVTGVPEDPPMPLAVGVLDAIIHEMQVKDENPGAVGAFSVDKTGPFRVTSYQTIEQTYTVGKLPMPEGGGLALGHQLMADYGIYQAMNPGGDNYVSVKCSNPAAKFKMAGTLLPSFIHGSYGSVTFTLEGTSLETGETITVTYGDRSGGSRGYQMQSYENDAFMLPIYVDLEGNKRYFSADWPWMKVVGGDAVAVTAVAPSVVAPGESFALSVRSEDLYFNRAGSGIPDYAVTLNGRAAGGTRASDGGISIVTGLTIDAPGVYRYEVESADGKIAGLSNPVWVQTAPANRIYWGETHGHTSMSEAQGSVDNYFRYGREDGRLDFIALSEHDAWMDDGEWRELIDAVRRFNAEKAFVVYLSFEWTANVQVGGHHNVLYRTAPERKRVPVQTAGVLSELYYGLRRDNVPGDVVVIPHAHIPGDWRMSDPKLERLVEITSMHGTFEWFGNYYLRNGHQVGFVGASDNHEGRPGYSGRSSVGAFQNFGGLGAVMAPELTRDAIFAAMRDISAYATSDAQRIILDADLNGTRMGKRLPFATTRELRCRVLGTSPIATMDVVKNGDIVFTQNFLTAPLESHCWVRVNFESTSESGLRDTPRGARVWKGAIEVRGATLNSVVSTAPRHPYVDQTRIDPEDGSRILLHTETRGRGNNILIELDRAKAATRIDIHLDSTKEHGNTYPVVYKPSTFPEEDFSVVLSELKEGAVTKAFATGDYTDHVTFELIDPEAPLDQEITFVDRKDPGHGDYYYVRVTQLNGARAWSSPWWVGGQRPR